MINQTRNSLTLLERRFFLLNWSWYRKRDLKTSANVGAINGSLQKLLAFEEEFIGRKNLKGKEKKGKEIKVVFIWIVSLTGACPIQMETCPNDVAQLEWMWHSLTRGSFVHLPWPDCRRRLVILSSCSPGCWKAHLSKQISASKTKYARHIHIIKLCEWPKVMKKLRIHFTCRQYHSIYFNLSLSVINNSCDEKAFNLRNKHLISNTVVLRHIRRTFFFPKNDFLKIAMQSRSRLCVNFIPKLLVYGYDLESAAILLQTLTSVYPNTTLILFTQTILLLLCVVSSC